MSEIRLVRVALRHEQDVVSARQRARQIAGLIGFEPQDQARIVCSGDVLLNSVPAGRYTLELTVTDETNKTSVSQQTRIMVE